MLKSMIAAGLVLASASSTVLADRHDWNGHRDGGDYRRDDRGWDRGRDRDWDRGRSHSSFGLSFGFFGNGNSSFGFGYRSGGDGYRGYGGGYSYVPAPAYCPPPVVYSASVYSAPVYVPPPVVYYAPPAVVYPYNSYYYGSGPGCYQSRTYYYYRR